jgi:hypothetical protein
MGQGSRRCSNKYRLECEIEQDALLIKSMPPSSMATSSTKNEQGERDPEMHQTKKDN